MSHSNMVHRNATQYIMNTVKVCLCCCFIISIVSVSGKPARKGLANAKMYDYHYKVESKKSDKTSVPFERITQLYNRGSGKHVQIQKTIVDAQGENGSPAARLVIRSDNFGRVRIRSDVSKYYICLSDSGRPYGVHERYAKSMSNCIFQEFYAKNYYTEFHSPNKTMGSLGFSRNGKGRRSWFVSSGHRSSQFLERPSKIIIDTEPSGNRPGLLKKSMVKKLQANLARLLQVYEKKFNIDEN